MELPRQIVVGEKNIGQVGEFLRSLSNPKKVSIISGKNVKKIIGKEIDKSLKNAKISAVWHLAKSNQVKETDVIQKKVKLTKSDIIIGLGGGRSVDFKTENTSSFGINPKIKSRLIDDLQNFIHPKQKVSLAMEWSGIMAFGKDKIPLIKKHQNNIALGVKLGGMGVAIGSQVGKKLAILLTD